MKKLIILGMILVLMGVATVALAAPPAQSPWVLISFCDHPSGASGEWYLNTYGGNYQCFKAE